MPPCDTKIIYTFNEVPQVGDGVWEWEIALYDFEGTRVPTTML